MGRQPTVAYGWQTDIILRPSQLIKSAMELKDFLE